MPLIPEVGRKQPRLRTLWYSLLALMVLGIVLKLFPFYFMLITSFKGALEIFQTPTTFWPKEPTLDAWKLVIELVSSNDPNSPTYFLRQGQPFYLYFYNSFFIATVTLLLSLPITALAAYANSKLQKGPIARWSFLFFIGTMMVPFIVVLIPHYLLVQNFPFAVPRGSLPQLGDGPVPTLSLFKTPWAVIVPGLFNAYNFLLFKGYFDTIPDSVIQAARVDGGSEFNIFRRIVLPMSIPVIAVAAYTQFSGVWDSYLWPSLVLPNVENSTMTVAIQKITELMTQNSNLTAEAVSARAAEFQQASAAGLSYNGLIVLGILQTLPIFIMFLLVRKYVLQGIKLRGFK
jgi:multiple sugar transport system permease protein